MTRAWSIVITGAMEQGDEKGLEHCDDKGSWGIVMSEVMEH